MDELPFSEGKKSSEKNSRKELPGYLYFFVCVFECECVCVCASAQSCPTLWNPMGCSPPASSVHGIFQAIIMEWVAFSYSRGSSKPRDWTLSSGISCVSCSSCIAGRFFTADPPVIFLTHENLDVKLIHKVRPSLFCYIEKLRNKML